MLGLHPQIMRIRQQNLLPRWAQLVAHQWWKTGSFMSRQNSSWTNSLQTDKWQFLTCQFLPFCNINCNRSCSGHVSSTVWLGFYVFVSYGSLFVWLHSEKWIITCLDKKCIFNVFSEEPWNLNCVFKQTKTTKIQPFISSLMLNEDMHVCLFVLFCFFGCFFFTLQQVGPYFPLIISFGE